MLDKSDTGRQKPNIFGIILLIMAVWGLNLYSDHHPSRWLAIGLSLAMAVGFSSYILYCLIKGRLLGGNNIFRRQWIYRDEEPFCYWFYMALYFCAVCLFITLTYQFAKELPLNL